MKRAFSDGTEAIIFTPGELIEKLVVLVARPRTHGITYHGVLAPAAAIRSEIVPQPDKAGGSQVATGPEKRKPPLAGRRPWAELLKRVFLVDALDCPSATAGCEPPRISPPRAPPQGDLFERGCDDAWADAPADDHVAA
jgi:hypothetical protein